MLAIRFTLATAIMVAFACTVALGAVPDMPVRMVCMK